MKKSKKIKRLQIEVEKAKLKYDQAIHARWAAEEYENDLAILLSGAQDKLEQLCGEQKEKKNKSNKKV